MAIIEKELEGNIKLDIVDVGEKYKTNYFSINFLVPLNKENMTRCNILTEVLCRGCVKYPTLKLINRKLSEYYEPEIAISAYKITNAIIIRAKANFLETDYLPQNEKVDSFEGVNEIFCEQLLNPLVEGDGLNNNYTESEKKKRIDIIKSEINNKDSYAFIKCEEETLGDIPFACDPRGTIEETNKVNSTNLKELLDEILNKAPIYMLFAGRYSDKYEKTIIKTAKCLNEKRDLNNLWSIDEVIKPKLKNEPVYINDKIEVKQGRLVMSYSYEDNSIDKTASVIFNELFGSSPISRLFTNVRERMQLCYYCSSMLVSSMDLIYVRSGISKENKEKAIKEINRQIELLKDPNNISDTEIEMAKMGIISSYKTVKDASSQYASWYFLRKLSNKDTDIDKVIENIKNIRNK